MNTIALFVSRLKATVRNVGAMSIFVLALVLSIVIGIYTQEKQEGMLRVAAVNRDSGELGSRLIEIINDNSELSVMEMDSDLADKSLRKEKIQAVFEISSDFTQKIENLEYKNLINIRFSPNCTIASSISEPITSAAIKLWFEKQTVKDYKTLLEKHGKELTEQQWQEFDQIMQDAWRGKSSTLDIVYISEKSSVPDPLISTRSIAILSWFASFSFLFLILNGDWISNFQMPALQLRLKQAGLSLSKNFFVQASAQLIAGLTGFFILALIDGALFAFPELSLYIFIYCLGILGMALVICTFLKNLTVLLIAGPLLSMGAALLSGLLTKLPDWGEVWVIISRFLPGRHFYNALQGNGQPGIAFLTSAGWLGLSLLISYFVMLHNDFKEKSRHKINT